MPVAALTRAAVAAATCAALLVPLAACGSTGDDARPDGRRTVTDGATSSPSARPGARPSRFDRVPGIGDRTHRRIPSAARQLVAVYGDQADSADATVVLYTKDGTGWRKARSWPAHNGRKGWTPDHREDDKRSPVGVFSLSDAGGVRPDPGAKLPYTRSAAFQAPRHWAERYWNDFDYVIAIDYNRVRGVPPNDPVRPQGRSKGGSIWFHLDHGGGTSGCVSLSRSGMEYLLRTLDPELRPVVVMGDKARLRT
ncbi:L,D-transpeptidase family protein [Streptomyces uncialis]|uniref:L,D-transpeptidase family protein n=1 Tax=Streptomyces uncialis TaxID=1048205 RepID=UPI002257A24D|nr:L,D-transpeptidase family protein [Streptomyces uncialis]MCX4657915.1 L,D-transpeptidase family protein [Streptomyces uncialis]